MKMKILPTIVYFNKTRYNHTCGLDSRDKKSFYLNTAELEADDGYPEASPQWLTVPFSMGKPLTPLWDSPTIQQ